MFGLNRLVSAVRGGLWLTRAGGLRERIDGLEQRCVQAVERQHDRQTDHLARLERELQQRAEALAQLEEKRWTELAGRFELLVEALRAASYRIARLEDRISAGQDIANGRWDELGARLGAFSREVALNASREEARLTDIAITTQGAHDRAFDAFRKAEQIDRLLRSRSRVFGHEMFLDPTDSIVSPFLLRDGYFEPYETALIESEICPGDVVLDIGANIGYYTLILARLVGEKGRVYAFEPDPTNFQLLKKNVRANGYHNVVFVQKAVSDASGALSLYLCPDNKGDHRIYDSHDERNVVTIEATTLDEHFSEFQGTINFIKMDIQGAEGRAVRGMRRLLERHRDVKLITEFWPAGLQRSGISAQDYLADLDRLGFRLFRIDEAEETTEPTSPDELLARFPAEREDFGNLYCARCA